MPAREAERAADLDLATDAVRAAGRRALELKAAGLQRWDKSPDNPVTNADLAVDHMLRARLMAARPDHGWLSEETADSPARLATRRLWVVDPIDGTRDFARGRDGWAVSVALVEDGAPVLALLFAPALDELYAATAGSGATLNGRPIGVSGRTEAAGMRLPVDPQFLTSRLWTEPWDAVAVPKPNSMALRVALVARGSADAAMDGRTTNEWDMAAAALILTEAGGAITDRHGEAFAFNKPRPTMPGLVAATPALHTYALDRLQAARRALDRAGIRAER